MGRKKKYLTESDRIEARNKRRMKYYWKNQKMEQLKNLNRYYEKSGNIQDNQ